MSIFAALPRLPISDGTGSTLDEFVSTIGLMVAAGTAVAGFQRTGRTGRDRVKGWVLVAVALLVAASAVTLPSRYLRAKPAKVRIASTATLDIVSPAEGEVVHKPSMDVVVRLNGGRIVPTASTRLRPDEGHLHVKIDGSVVSMTFGLSQPVDISDLKPGTHTLEAEFVASDHGPFVPRVRTSISFEVA